MTSKRFIITVETIVELPSQKYEKNHEFRVIDSIDFSIYLDLKSVPTD